LGDWRLPLRTAARLELVRPLLAATISALAVACTNDFDTLAVATASGGDMGGDSTSSAAAPGSGGSPSAPRDAGVGGTPGLGADVSDAGAAGGARSAAGSGGAPAPPPPCADQYGPAATVMCQQTETECAFNFANASQSCGDVCASFGGECVAMYIDSGEDNCGFDPAAPQECGYVGWNDAICVCSRGCGGGPACAAPATCTANRCL
jgi:hypothetical protein